MKIDFFVNGGDFSKAGVASSMLKKVLKQLNVDARIIRRVIVALYEAEVNIVAHAYEGEIVIEIDTEKIKIVLNDKGPGIPDIEMAMTVGYSTASAKVREMGFGAGMGLPNIKNNCDKLELTSIVGEGTRLEMITYIK